MKSKIDENEFPRHSEKLSFQEGNRFQKTSSWIIFLFHSTFHYDNCKSLKRVFENRMRIIFKQNELGKELFSFLLDNCFRIKNCFSAVFPMLRTYIFEIFQILSSLMSLKCRILPLAIEQIAISLLNPLIFDITNFVSAQIL